MRSIPAERFLDGKAWIVGTLRWFCESPYFHIVNKQVACYSDSDDDAVADKWTNNEATYFYRFPCLHSYVS